MARAFSRKRGKSEATVEGCRIGRRGKYGAARTDVGSGMGGAKSAWKSEVGRSGGGVCETYEGGVGENGVFGQVGALGYLDQTQQAQADWEEESGQG